MVQILIDLPDDVNEEVAIYSIKEKFFDKRLAIIDILEKYFKIKWGEDNVLPAGKDEHKVYSEFELWVPESLEWGWGRCGVKS